MRKANKENWKRLRDETESRTIARVQQKTANAIANNAVKLEKARGMLIDKFLAAIEQMPKHGGTHIRQTQTDKETGKQMSIDYDLSALVNTFEKLTTGTTADLERQQQFIEDNNTTLMGYADLFSRPARQRTIEELERGNDVSD